MTFHTGVPDPANVDPLLLLLLADAETVEEEMEAQSSYEQALSFQAAALRITRFNSQE